MMTLTTSRLSALRTCQRLHKFRYLDGYKPVQVADALRLGTLVHLGLEAWWRADGNRLDAALVAMAGESDPFELAKAQAMLIGYDARWLDADLTVLGVEEEFDTDLRHPESGTASPTWRLAGKIDAIVKDAQGRTWLVEHKTASEDIASGSDYWRRLRMDAQVSTYLDGARALGFEPVGVLYDVLRKPGLRPLKANKQRTEDETPEQYRDRCVADLDADSYQRSEVVRLERDIDEARWDRWDLALQLEDAMAAGRYPRNPGACMQYGRSCPYLTVCCGEASLDDPTLFQKSDVVHPELVQLNKDRGNHAISTQTAA